MFKRIITFFFIIIIFNSGLMHALNVSTINNNTWGALKKFAYKRKQACCNIGAGAGITIASALGLFLWAIMMHESIKRESPCPHGIIYCDRCRKRAEFVDGAVFLLSLGGSAYGLALICDGIIGLGTESPYFNGAGSNYFNEIFFGAMR